MSESIPPRGGIVRFVNLAAEEPFRVFFPLGFVCGAAGVALWPLFFAGAISTYPATLHARLMIEGMMSSFIFGFLGTAGPRLMSVPHFSGGEVLRLSIVLGCAMATHCAAAHALGDTVFLVALLLFAIALARRFPSREDSPPPNFALVALGLVNGLVGVALVACSEWTVSSPTLYRLGSAFLNVGFVLLPVLGVAPFFIRRLLDLPANTDDAGSWRRDFALALAVGTVIDGSFIVELVSSTSATAWVRCFAALFYLAMTLPLRGTSRLASALRMSLATIPAAFGLVALFPAYRISALHVLFIGTFSLAVFTVATRVVLGHSGKLGLLQRRGWLLLIALVMLILAMISRFLADFTATRNEHLIGAAAAWLIGAAIWAVIVLPNIARSEEE